MTESDSRALAEGSVPAEAFDVLAAARKCFDAALLAAYLHGSAVAGGLRRDSDIDILLVIDRPMLTTERQRLLSELMGISSAPKSANGRRPLEVIIFSAADLQSLPYPARSEFVYGEWLRVEFEAGQIPQPDADPEYTVLLAQARQTAQTLAGPPPHELLPEISHGEVLRAILDARKSLISSLEGDERNVLLTLARMWRTLATGDIVPKDVAAEWAIPLLSEASGRLMTHARLAYLGLADDDWRDLHAEMKAAIEELNHHLAALEGSASI